MKKSKRLRRRCLSEILGNGRAGKPGIADGIQAIKVLREHAQEFGVSPDRVVFMGFSAGGMITEYAAVNPDASARPNYAAPIYGAPFPVPPIPKGVPPFFMR